MRLKTEELDEIETVTLDHYNHNAEAFWSATLPFTVSREPVDLVILC